MGLAICERGENSINAQTDFTKAAWCVIPIRSQKGGMSTDS
jgi:hypothetical protein